MKKFVYPLVAALILCLVGIGMLLSARVGDRNEMQRLQAEIAALNEEKADWDAQKTQVSKSLSGVRSVLVKTLVDLEDVSATLGTAMDTIVEMPGLPEASSTLKPEVTDAPEATDKPEAKGTAAVTADADKATVSETPKPAASTTAPAEDSKATDTHAAKETPAASPTLAPKATAKP